MKCKVRQTVARHNMIPCGSVVCVALSGGADSMALLNVLNELKDELHFSLCAAHVNHGIRGAEANRDEAFVTELCEAMGIPLHKALFDVPAVSAETGEGIEECGRRLRYAFLESIDADFIATAHNLNDRIETFLFNFTRGSGAKGLCSIPYVRGKVIRPLLDCSRGEIEEYCRVFQIPFVHDSTNDDVAYSRNRIRHHVINELKAINPAFEEAALRCMDVLTADEDYLESCADGLIAQSKRAEGYDVGVLRSAHSAVLSRAVLKIISEAIGTSPNHREIENVMRLLHEEGQTQLSENRVARVRKGLLGFPVFCQSLQWQMKLNIGTNFVNDIEVDVAVSARNDNEITQFINTKSNIFLLDYDKIAGNLSVRNRREGDAVRLAGRHCTKTIKKLFNESGVLPEKRDGIMFITDDNGILAVEDFGVCERAAVTENTEKLLKISFGRK